MSDTIRRGLFSIFLLLFTGLVGVVGFHLIEGYNWVDASYMTAITMSTVGFGTVGELSAEGKLFSILLISFSVGTFLYAISTITTLVVEGEIRQAFNQYKVDQQVAKLQQHIIICGLGRNGREVAREFMTQTEKFVVVEQNEEVIEDFLESFPQSLVIEGDATHEEVLDKANIANARALVSALSTDAENVYITLTARGMNPRLRIIARASHESSIAKLKRAGADRVIVPNLIGGRKMANLITRPALVEFTEMVSGDSARNNLHLMDVPCEMKPKLVGKTLAELDIRSQTGVLVLGLKAGSHPIELNPGPNRKLETNDRIFILGQETQLDIFEEKFG
ncbi:MAG: potassium channel protein [Bacteroidota bacterium]